MSHPVYELSVLSMAIALATAAVVGCENKSANSPSTLPSAEKQTATQTEPSEGGGAGFEIRSDAFQQGGAIPVKYTCEGEDISPPLVWLNLPDKTRSLALIVDDPDAPDPDNPKMTWVHWVLFNIPPDTTALAEGVKELPAGARSGLNDWKRTGYGGPCPPIGRHRYFHKLYALSTALDLDKPTKAELEAAMQGHVLQKTELIGTYQKQK